MMQIPSAKFQPKERNPPGATMMKGSDEKKPKVMKDPAKPTRAIEKISMIDRRINFDTHIPFGEVYLGGSLWVSILAARKLTSRNRERGIWSVKTSDDAEQMLLRKNQWKPEKCFIDKWRMRLILLLALCLRLRSDG